MLAVVWCVEGARFDVEEFIARFGLAPDVIWREGEHTRRGRPYATSGLSLSIDTAETMDGILQDILRFVRTEQPMLEAARTAQLSSVIDIGFTVGDDDHFTRTLRVPPELLAELGASGISLEVSAYPAWAPADTAKPPDAEHQ